MNDKIVSDNKYEEIINRMLSGLNKSPASESEELLRREFKFYHEL